MIFYTDKKVSIVMKKYKEKYKTGMIFRSKKYPWADIIIDYVSYNRMAENSYGMCCVPLSWNRDMPGIWLQ